MEDLSAHREIMRLYMRTRTRADRVRRSNVAPVNVQVVDQAIDFAFTKKSLVLRNIGNINENTLTVLTLIIVRCS